MSDKNKKNPSNVDQIRDLIFGSQINDIEDRFKSIDKSIEKIETKLINLFEESSNNIKKETERSMELLEEKIDNLSSSSQAGRVNLKELLDTLDSTLNNQLNDQKNEFIIKIKNLKESTSDDNKKISEDLKQVNDELKHMIEDGLLNLNEDKVSRDSMSLLLLDIAMKLQTPANETEDNEGDKTEK